MANVKERKEPRFGMLRHIYPFSLQTTNNGYYYAYTLTHITKFTI